MAVHEFTDSSGATIKLEAKNRDEAYRLLTTADPAQVERAIRLSEKGGLTPQDVTALFGGQGYKADAKGMTLRPLGLDTGINLNEGVAEGLVGAGRTFESWGHGAQQIVGDAAVEADVAKNEAAARALFQQLDDEGVGAEDIGQALPAVIAAFGGGVVGAGWKALMATGAATGAALGAIEGTAEGESRGINAAIGGVLGAAAPLLGMTPGLIKSAVGSGATMSKAAVNWLGTLVATAKGNAQTAIFTTSRALSAVNAANNQAQAALSAAHKAGNVGPGVRTAALLAQRAQDQLAKIIAGMRGKPANEVAFNMANDAFEAGFSAKTGQLVFNPAAARNALARVLPRDVKKLGEVGEQLMIYKQFLRAVENVDDLSPDTIRAAARWIMDDPAAETLVKTIQDTLDPAVKRSLINQLTRQAGLVAGPVGTGHSITDQMSEPTE